MSDTDLELSHAELPAPDTETDTDSEAAAAPEGPAPARYAAGPMLPALAAAVIVGGLFRDLEPRLVAAVGVLAVGALAYYAARSSRPWLGNLALAGGLFLAGLVAAAFTGGVDSALNVGREISLALREAHLVRPPITLIPGFAALLAWLSGAIGLASVTIASDLRRPGIALLIPLPVAALAAISLPADETVPSGLALLVACGVGFGLVSGLDQAGGERLPLAYELRRAARALPVLAAVTAALYFAAQSSLLFPKALINPNEQPQKPHTVPITQVPDRVLFEVSNTPITGPWVIGTLDVYDGTDWRLPPIAQEGLVPIHSDGIVDRALHPGLEATFTIRGLGGAILPGLPGTVGVLASGPRLAYDRRSEVIRLVEGEITPGFSYRVAAAAVPDVAVIQKDNGTPGSAVRDYLSIPPPPPAVVALLKQAPKSSKWDEFDFLRNWVLQNVTASGPGQPVSITPQRVQEIVGVTRQASPFEIVALQAMLGRWAGLPARIGYGFDGGIRVNNHLEVHPTDGAAFPEVYFPGFDWLPVVGVPLKAKVSETSDSRFQRLQQGVQPSDDISVPIVVPQRVPTTLDLYQVIRLPLLLALLAALLAALIYFSIPIARKAVARARRRSEAAAAGPRARIVQAYSEWRDLLADFHCDEPGDSPIMLLRHFVADDEHAHFAWLVTRALWGDLERGLTGGHAAEAEELSRSLRRRLSQSFPLSERVVAAMSRASLRHPYHADRHAADGFGEEVESVAV